MDTIRLVPGEMESESCFIPQKHQLLLSGPPHTVIDLGETLCLSQHQEEFAKRTKSISHLNIHWNLISLGLHNHILFLVPSKMKFAQLDPGIEPGSPEGLRVDRSESEVITATLIERETTLKVFVKLYILF